MALGTLGDLRTTVLVTRPDMVPRFSDFLALAEQRMYYGGDGVPPLRIRGMETTADLAFTSGSASLPTGFLDKRALYWRGAITVPVGYEPPSVFYGQEVDRRGGSLPEAFTVEGNTIKISPDLTGTGKLLHYAKASTLSADGDSNAVLAVFPGVYLYGCQVELARASRDREEEGFNLKRYSDAVQAANTHTIMSRTFGGPVAKRVGFAL